jgi:hypothetical protein
MHHALSALMEFVEKDSPSDLMCRECFRIFRDELGIQDEKLLIAARFMYPLSPGKDREKQLNVLQDCGYALNDAKRIITLMETQRGLEGDPQKQALAEVMVRLFLSDPFYKPDDSYWAYEVGRLWNHTTAATRASAQEKCATLKALPTDFTYLELHSGILGNSVRDSFPTGCGFPDVHFPWLGHAVEIVLFDPISAPMDEFDRCIRIWTEGSARLREDVREGLIAYKDLIADACGEGFSHITAENVFSHIDLTHGHVSDGEDGLRLSIGEGCSWEPEHGVYIVLDQNGALQKVGEL